MLITFLESEGERQLGKYMQYSEWTSNTGSMSGGLSDFSYVYSLVSLDDISLLPSPLNVATNIVTTTVSYTVTSTDINIGYRHHHRHKRESGAM